MRLDFQTPPKTLGELLTDQARRLAMARLPRLPWLRTLQRVRQRIFISGDAFADRFRRIEVSDPFALPQSRAEAVDEAPGAPGRAIDPEVRSRLQSVVGPGVEAVRVHRGEHADAFAREHRADAVTVGTHVYFRRSRFRPCEPEGFALLAHEASHVLEAMRPGSSWRRATEAGVAVEEQTAVAQEQRVLRQTRPAPWVVRRLFPQGLSQPPVSESRPAASASPAIRPMAAAEGRPADTTTTPEAPTAPNLDDLRRTLYRELMETIRSDFERGA